MTSPRFISSPLLLPTSDYWGAFFAGIPRYPIFSLMRMGHPLSPLSPLRLGPGGALHRVRV